MSDPLPVNAKERSKNSDSSHMSEHVIAGSFDRAESTARLGTSPLNSHMQLGTSPAKSIQSHQSYGSHYLKPTDNEPSRPRSPHRDNLSADMSDRKVAKAVKRHLVSHSPSASSNHVQLSSSPSQNGRSQSGPNNSSGDSSDSEVASVHHLHGGAITHDIYKWTESVEQDRKDRMKRSQSVAVLRKEPTDPALTNLKDPGGFRRFFIINRATKSGKAPPSLITRSFVDFLALYGHYAGEYLRDEEDSDDEEEFQRYRWSRRYDEEGGTSDERTALLRQCQAKKTEGTATPSKVVFLLLKSFIGTGVMFLPKAFHNGGLMFSTIFLACIAAISLYGFLLLVETQHKIPASFGDIGGILYGKTMRFLVLIAVTTSQIGLVCAYMVFVAQNAQALIEVMSNCKKQISLEYLILAQIAIYIPLAFIRKIQKLSVFALIADAFILIGLLYLYYYDFLTLALQGVGKVEWGINTALFPMFIGTAVFTFEGVGLIIPIADSMKEPKKFPKVLSWTMLFVATLFISIGFLSYLVFGQEVKTVILLNLPSTPVVNSIQGLYATAICLSIPLQLFPAIRIIETGLFSRSGKYNMVVKWQKNLFRIATVLFCAAVAIAGSRDLDKFVSLIGSVFCIPLCFLFPPLFHYKAVASTFKQKFIDGSIIVFGSVCMVYTTFITISLWSSGGDPELPASQCIPHDV